MKEENNIVKINRKELSKEAVLEKENLDSIINAHRKITKRPIYKQKKFYFFLFLLLIITLLVYYADKEESKEDKRPAETEATN